VRLAPPDRYSEASGAAVCSYLGVPVGLELEVPPDGTAVLELLLSGAAVLLVALWVVLWVVLLPGALTPGVAVGCVLEWLAESALGPRSVWELV
jgi:hypothetical protein